MMQEHSLQLIVWGLFISSIKFGATASLSDNGNDHITQPGSTDSSSLDITVPPLNASALSTANSTATANEHDIVCNPGMGSNFDLNDCLASLQDFEIGRARMTFAKRPLREGTIPLPFRWMGRK